MDRNPAMPSDSSSENGEPERANSSVFRSLHGLLGAEDSRRTRKAKKGSSWRKKGGNKYLKPGALAQLRDARMNTRASSCTAIGRKRVLVLDYDKANVAAAGEGVLTKVSYSSYNSSLLLSPPNAPQKKMLLTPKTPSTPVTPKTPTALSLGEAQDPEAESRLESLPFDLLVKILCLLHHDQLKSVFHVSQRIRKVAVIARQCYFNYTTPDRSRQEMLKLTTPRPDEQWPFLEGGVGVMPHPVTPKAPRHDQRPLARLSLAEMRQISASLFQGPSSRFYRNKPPGLPRPAFRSLPSHRVLFYEDELCQAVAQNTIV